MISYEIERLLRFAQKNGLIEDQDVTLSRNALLDLLRVAEPYKGEVACENETAAEVLERILDYCAETGLLTENSSARRDAFVARIMGLLMPRQS